MQNSPYYQYVNPTKVAMLDSLQWDECWQTALGSYLTDTDGNEFLDLSCNFGTAALGHNHPLVHQAISDCLSRQALTVSPFSVPNGVGELAGQLLKLADCALNKVYFGTSGADAIESAMKFAQATTGRSRFISINKGFHGLTSGAMSLLDVERWHQPFATAPASANSIAINDIPALAAVLGDNDVAALVIETVQGLAGGEKWQDEAMQQLISLCKSHGTLLIVDEVLTGLGRTGRWFGFQHYAGFQPDIVVCSKVLSGGMVPISAVLMTDVVYKSVFGKTENWGIHSSTFSTYQIGIAVANAVVDILIKDDMLQQVQQKSAYIRNKLTEAIPADWLTLGGEGLLLTLKINEQQAPVTAYELLCILRDNEVLVALAGHASDTLKLTPAFTIEYAQLDSFTEMLSAIFDAVKA